MARNSKLNLGYVAQVMQYLVTCVACLTLCISSFSQEVNKTRQSFEDIVKGLKKKNDAEGFTYAYLDAYLATPTEARLQLFTEYETLLWRPLQSPDEYLAYTILLCNKGYYLTKFGNPYKAIEAYEKGWMLFNANHLTNFDIVEYCLKPLANNYSMLGDYTSAGNIVKNYLFIAEKEKNYKHVISGLINLSIIYHETGNYNDAIGLLQQGLRIEGVTPEKQALLYSNLARNYLSLKDLRNSMHYGARAIAILKRLSTPETPVQLVNVYSLLSQAELQKKNLGKSLTYIRLAQQLALTNKRAFTARELAKLNNNYAELLNLKNQFNDALKTYKQSLAVLLPNQLSTKDSMPDPAFFYAENAIKETLDGLALVYLNLGEVEKTLTYLELSFFVEDLIRKTYNYDEPKLQQQIENRDRTEQALALLFSLYKTSGGNHYAMRAFQLAERTKAITLKEKIESREARKYLKQDSLDAYERELHYKHATLAADISVEQMKQGGANVTRINGLVTAQTQISIRLKALEKEIQAAPGFYDSKNSSTKIDVARLQKRLGQSNAILLEYFTGRDALYKFTISSQAVGFTKISALDSVKKKIIQLNGLLASPPSINNNMQQYNDLAFDLFKNLQIPGNAAEKKMVIIPDGVLGLIPFEALVYEPTKSRNYTATPFLLKKFNIVYQSAAAVYLNDGAFNTPFQKNILGVFPVFKNTTMMLQYAEKEASEIHKLMDGKYLYGEQATKKAFLDNLAGYPILHLSTHASSGTVVEPPSITFIDSILYLPQIYGLHLKTDLLILSACETGVGTLVKGEGAVSLARGFQLAGVQNLIFSLWKVNDYSTSTLMTNFYAHYIRTKSKDESIHRAKLDYLADETISNSHKSPYYWSGFVYYGNTEVAVEENDLNIAFILGVGLLILLIVGAFLFVYKRR